MKGMKITMKEQRIRLKTPQEIIDFVAAVSEIPGHAVLKSGNIEANVRSLLGILECDVANECGVTMVGSPEICDAVKHYVV